MVQTCGRGGTHWVRTDVDGEFPVAHPARTKAAGRKIAKALRAGIGPHITCHSADGFLYSIGCHVEEVTMEFNQSKADAFANRRMGVGRRTSLASAPLAASQPRRSEAEAFRYSLRRGLRPRCVGQYRPTFFGRRAGSSRSGDVRCSSCDAPLIGNGEAHRFQPTQLLRRRNVRP